jgi:galactose-1-phosphate uridylyltransferase
VDAPEDGNASMPEQVKRPNPWRKKKKKMMMIKIKIMTKFLYDIVRAEKLASSLSRVAQKSFHQLVQYILKYG